jgi:CheY-like chemotaxis protein
MSARVLVADGDASRGREVAEACAQRGMVCLVVTHGVVALDAALSDPPDALICQLGLPLIDGERLASILRNNPHTRDLAVLFIGDLPGDADRARPGDEVFVAPVDPEVVATCLQTGLVSREGASEPPERGGDEGGVEGQLAQLPLSDLLQLFHVSRKTGTVELVRGSTPGRRELGRVVLRAGDLAAASVGAAQGEKALYRLLAWERGSFSFRPGVGTQEVNLHRATRTLLAEGLRQIREWRRLAVDLPPMNASVTLKVARSALPNVIHPITQEVLVVLDLYSRVKDVVDHCSYPDYQVLRTLHTLDQRGMVELRVQPEPQELAREAWLFSPTRTARLREWLEVDRPGGVAQDAKLLVVPSDANVTRDFARHLQRLPGVEIDARLETGALAIDDLVSLGRVAADTEVGIELVHVPAAERFGPVWPVAGHGALATLLLLSGPVSRAVATVGGVARALRQLPRTRVFHVLMLEKGDRINPDELCENLSIVDEGSLFLIPAESPEKAGVLLREMFGRILP